MRTESEIRQQGLEWSNVERAFIWDNLSRNFIRELVEYDSIYKTMLEHHLIAALQGFAVYPSTFFQNMGYYISNKLAEQRQLVNYVDKIYQLYRQQAEQEYNSRQVYSLVNNSGRILDSIVY